MFLKSLKWAVTLHLIEEQSRTHISNRPAAFRFKRLKTCSVGLEIPDLDQFFRHFHFPTFHVFLWFVARLEDEDSLAYSFAGVAWKESNPQNLEVSWYPIDTLSLIPYSIIYILLHKYIYIYICKLYIVSNEDTPNHHGFQIKAWRWTSWMSWRDVQARTSRGVFQHELLEWNMFGVYNIYIWWYLYIHNLIYRILFVHI